MGPHPRLYSTCRSNQAPCEGESLRTSNLGICRIDSLGTDILEFFKHLSGNMHEIT